ncbi:hypothetical protein [Streptomyces sp. NPDC047043]|uniref:hypothetical protein n=1 Tax=Streptomyces sp. NPDC047043 TaxID=3154497 RepID=UPI0033E27807
MTDDHVHLEHEFDLDITYDPSLWLELPPRWETETWQDIDAWASECAELLWRSHGNDPGPSGLPFLTETLRRCAEAFSPEDFATRVLLHVWDPVSMPLPLFASVEPAQGERDAILRTLVLAADPDAVEPPVVEPHRAELVGDGLRSFRYVSQEDANELLAGLRYAWRDDEAGADVLLRTVTDHVVELMRATEDIEKLTHRIQVRIWDLEPTGEILPGAES